MKTNSATQSAQLAENGGEQAGLSLTPCFSGVLCGNRAVVNRFNGFRVMRARWETVKTVARLRSRANTLLKQGVNESERGDHKSSSRSHDAKSPAVSGPTKKPSKP
jgi:hypothetical protein